MACMLTGMPDGPWDPLFEDLEHQFAAQREREEQALAGETARAQAATLTLADRLAALPPGSRVSIRDSSGETHTISVAATGPEWIAGENDEAQGLTIVRIDAIDELRFSAAVRASTLSSPRPDPLRARMGMGFVLRALARRRAGVTLGTARGGRLSGTLARAGVDHADLTLHDLGASALEARDEVTIAIRAIAWIRTRDPRSWRAILEL